MKEKRQRALEVARRSHACLEEPGGKGLLKPKPMPRGCPPAPPSPNTSRVREPPLPFPGSRWCAKPWCKRPQKSSILTVLLGSCPGAGSSPKLSSWAVKRLRELLQCPPAHAHTLVDAATSLARREGATGPTKSQPGFSTVGWRSAECLVTGVQFSSSFGKGRALTGRKLLRATICAEGTDLPTESSLARVAQGCMARTPLLVQQGEQELLDTPRKSLQMPVSQARDDF